MPSKSAPIEVFRKFDAYMGMAGKMTVTTADDTVRILRQAIDLLPQREAIESNDIQPWLDRTMTMAARRPGIETVQDVFVHVLWHVRRASGIGGSESGSMLAHYAEEGATFQSAREIVQQKLLKAAPSPATRHMARGVRAEEHIQRIFLEQHKVKSRTDLVDRTRGFRPEKAPWIIGTPDDIVEADNHILIADYKAPSTDIYEKLEKEVSFEYTSQLHHYGIVANAAGIKFSGIALAPFSHLDFTVGFFKVPFDVKFARELAGAATKIWCDHVMQGVLPDITQVPDITPEDPVVRHLVYKAVTLKEISKEVEARFKEINTQLATHFEHETGLATGKAAFLAADYSRVRTYDDEQLQAMALAHGLNPEEFYTSGVKTDPEKAVETLERLYDSLADRAAFTAVLKQFREEGLPRVRKFEAELCADALTELGADITPALGVQNKFAISRKKKGVESEQVGRIRDMAVELVDALEETFDIDLRQQLAEISFHGVTPPDDPDGEALDDAELEAVLDFE